MSGATFVHGDILKMVPRAWDRVPCPVIERPFVVFDTKFTKHALTIDKLEPVLSTF